MEKDTEPEELRTAMYMMHSEYKIDELQSNGDMMGREARPKKKKGCGHRMRN